MVEIAFQLFCDHWFLVTALVISIIVACTFLASSIGNDHSQNYEPCVDQGDRREIHRQGTKEFRQMLVLSRHRDESIRIADNITVMIVDIRGDKVRLGIEAPPSVAVHRSEVYDAIQREKKRNEDNDGSTAT